jgi:hypothetical protein
MKKLEIAEELLKSKLDESINTGFNIFVKIKNYKNYRHFTVALQTEWLKAIKVEGGENYPVSERIKEKFFIEFNKKDPELNKKVCLYAFEYPNEEANYIVQTLNGYRDNTSRSVSAIKDNPNKEGNILYIGKVKKGLGGRLSTHFGFAHEKTGGLQLRHWLKKDMLLTVHIFAFEKEVDDFINPLELFLSNELKPLIGKSK